jgi:coatomer subunit beta'
LSIGEVELAIRCYDKISDLNGLLLVYSSLSLPKQLAELGEKAERLCKMNVAFQCYFMTNQPLKCFNVLIQSKRFSEAALFARTYIPEKISEAV